ncbi:MAG: chorismate mutase [Pseudomonadota bacterium]
MTDAEKKPENNCVTLATAPAWLQDYRAQIDALDDQIVALLHKRHGVIRAVAARKKEAGIPAILPDRVAQVIDRNAENAANIGMDDGLVRRLYTDIVATSCALEQALIAPILFKKRDRA